MTDQVKLFSHQSKTLHTICILINLILCLGIKGLLFKWIFKMKHQCPHNKLFLIIEIERLTVIITSTVINIYDLIQSDSSDLQNSGVRVLMVTLPNIAYSGELATVLLKFIYIKFPMTVHTWGKSTIMALILMFWHCIVAGLTCNMVYNAGANLDNYAGEPNYFSKDNLTVICQFLTVLFEFLVYASICQLIYKSDLSVQGLISIENFQKRRNKLLACFTKHFMFFLLEVILVIGQSFSHVLVVM